MAGLAAFTFEEVERSTEDRNRRLPTQDNKLRRQMLQTGERSHRFACSWLVGAQLNVRLLPGSLDVVGTPEVRSACPSADELARRGEGSSLEF